MIPAAAPEKEYAPPPPPPSDVTKDPIEEELPVVPFASVLLGPPPPTVMV
jgi:hypothetical protein